MGAKADVDVQDSKSGKTALHHAVENDDLPMVGYLVTEVSLKIHVCLPAFVTRTYLFSGTEYSGGINFRF